MTHLVFEADGESFFGERDHGTARNRLFVEKTKNKEFITPPVPHSRQLLHPNPAPGATAPIVIPSSHML
jgi:hypothetical protein